LPATIYEQYLLSRLDNGKHPSKVHPIVSFVYIHNAFYFVRQNTIYNVANSATKIPK